MPRYYVSEGNGWKPSDVEDTDPSKLCLRSLETRLEPLLKHQQAMQQEKDDYFQHAERYNTLPSLPNPPTCKPFDHANESTTRMFQRNMAEVYPTGSPPTSPNPHSLKQLVQSAREDFIRPPGPYQPTMTADNIYQANLVNLSYVAEAVVDLARKKAKPSAEPDVTPAMQIATGLEYCSRAQWDALTRIDLPYMWLNKIHMGRYIILRVIALPAIIKSSITLLACDPTGHAVNIKLINYAVQPCSLGEPSVDDWCALFPAGTIIAIKEPELVMTTVAPYTARSTTVPEIVINTPTNWTVVQEDHDLLKKVAWFEANDEPWKKTVVDISLKAAKKRGNLLTSRKQYLRALMVYEEAIRQHKDDPEVTSLRVRRCGILLKLERFTEAYSEGSVILNLLQSEHVATKLKCNGPTPWMLLFNHLEQIAEALDGMRWYPAAHQFWKLAAEVPLVKSDRVKAGLEACKARHFEALGIYDVVKLFMDTEAKPDTRHTVADYIGPIQVFQGSHGRGLKASSNVKAGDLLMVTKALAASFPEDAEKCDRVPIVHVLGGNSSQAASQIMRKELIYKIFHNPLLRPQIYYLAGAASPGDPYYLSTPDIFHLPQIVKNMPMDYHHLTVAVTRNGFKGHSDKRKTLSSSFRSSTIYGPSSMFNHSCLPNTSLYTIGDVQFIRAAVDIKAGEELYLSYNSGYGGTYDSRREMCTKLGFECTCQLCTNERKDGLSTVRQRESIYEPHVDGTTQMSHIRRVQRDIESMTKTYGSHWDPTTPRVLVAAAQADLGWMYTELAMTTNNPSIHQDAIREAKASLVSLSAEIAPSSHMASSTAPVLTRLPRGERKTAIRAAINLAGTYQQLGDDLARQRWLETAASLHNMYYGGGNALFVMRKSHFLMQWDLVEHLDINEGSYKRVTDQLEKEGKGLKSSDDPIKEMVGK